MALPDLKTLSDDELVELVNSYHRQINYDPFQQQQNREAGHEDEALFDDMAQLAAELFTRKIDIESSYKIVNKDKKNEENK